MQEAVEAMLRAYVDDGYGFFDNIPETLARELGGAPEAVRVAAAEYANVMAGDSKNSLGAERLEVFATQMLGEGGRTKRRR